MHAVFPQERKEQLEAQYEATAADLERERQLNADMQTSVAVLEGLKANKDSAVAVLEAAAAADPPAQRMQLAGVSGACALACARVC